jgi:hypothetical protein
MIVTELRKMESVSDKETHFRTTFYIVCTQVQEQTSMDSGQLGGSQTMSVVIKRFPLQTKNMMASLRAFNTAKMHFLVDQCLIFDRRHQCRYARVVMSLLSPDLWL